MPRFRTCALVMVDRNWSATICAFTGQLYCSNQSKTAPADVPACGFGTRAGGAAGAEAAAAVPKAATPAAGAAGSFAAGAGGSSCSLDFAEELDFEEAAHVFCSLELLATAPDPAKSSSLSASLTSAELASWLVPSPRGDLGRPIF
eukprot:scaffold134174_cov37-Tisochrysis_lutea.AAC.1